MSKEPQIHIIVAMTHDQLIGSEGRLPWDIRADLRIFRELTMGQTVIMGRKTFASIGSALPGRNNIVITSGAANNESIETFNSFARGLERAMFLGKEIFCIGGADIYREALPLASYLHISWVNGDYTGETFFPDFNLDEWVETAQDQQDGFTHISYQRK